MPSLNSVNWNNVVKKSRTKCIAKQCERLKNFYRNQLLQVIIDNEGFTWYWNIGFIYLYNHGFWMFAYWKSNTS